MRLFVDDRGTGVGGDKTVVLLHGFPLDRSMWDEQVAALAPTCRVITPDLRGHGNSSAEKGVYTIDGMADDLIETLDALSVKDAILGGLSLGGYVALSAILRYPDHFRGLILMDTRAGADTPEVARGREMSASKVDGEGNAKAVVDGMIPRLFAPDTLANRPDLVAAVRSVMERTDPGTVSSSLRGMAIRPDRMADLPSITVPSLVIVGEHDAITPVADARAMAAALPEARLEIIPNAGHLSPMENPADVNRAIVAFLGTL